MVSGSPVGHLLRYAPPVLGVFDPKALAADAGKVWRAYCRRQALNPDPPSTIDELDLEGEYPFDLGIGPGAQVRTVFFTTKQALPHRLFDRFGYLPRGVALVVRHGVPTAPQLSLAHDLARTWKRPIRFFGDLDPICLATYLCLACNDPALLRPRTAVPVRRLGVDDRWLRRLKGWVGADRVARYGLRMDDAARGLWELEKRLYRGWEALLGKESVRLLDSGQQYEMEAFGSACSAALKEKGKPTLARLLGLPMPDEEWDPDDDHPSQEEVERRLQTAIDHFLRDDRQLLDLDTSERSMCAAFARHLASEFWRWDVDCEYDRDGHMPKRVGLPGADAEGARVYPDIIVHHRGTNRNLVAIEAKKAGNDTARDEDKLAGYKTELGYAYAVMLDIDPTRGKVTYRFR